MCDHVIYFLDVLAALNFNFMLSGDKITGNATAAIF